MNHVNKIIGDLRYLQNKRCQAPAEEKIIDEVVGFLTSLQETANRLSQAYSACMDDGDCRFCPYEDHKAPTCLAVFDNEARALIESLQGE